MTRWQNLAPPELAARLAAELARGLPGRRAQRVMAPELAYGRHHGPVPRSVRRAAVLLLLERDGAGYTIPAIVRPTTMKAHPGQVSLPGGMIEPNESAAQTALREFHEELGAATADIQVLGTLSPVFVFISNFEVAPVLAVGHRPLAFRPSPDEVAQVVPIRVEALLDPASRDSHLVRRGELVFRAPHYTLGGKQVWGATSLILAEFAELAARLA